MYKLFVIDDDEDILFVLNYWLQLQGFEVFSFTCSKPLFAAIEMITPNLILLDVNLKGEDGRVICKQLKTDFKISCPVILISANPLMKLNFQESFAAAFIEKPFELKKLKAVIDAYVIAA